MIYTIFLSGPAYQCSNEPRTTNVFNCRQLNEKTITEIGQAWHTKTPLESSTVSLEHRPFIHCIIPNFIEDDFLCKKICDEYLHVDFKRRQMDLYEFFQSSDLQNSHSKILKGFYDFLKTKVMIWVEGITKIKLNKVSASLSMYNCGDFLLPHDDLMSDRKIAFIYYVSPWNGMDKWCESMGGSLQLFTASQDGPFNPPAKKLFPANNQFVFFEVSKDSFHQVEEVKSYDFPRLTINGWFHGTQPNVESKLNICAPHFTSPTLAEESLLTSVVNPLYLQDKTIQHIHKQIEELSETSLENFFNRNFYDTLACEIQKNELKWTAAGPVNARNYEVLPINPEVTVFSKLLEFMTSTPFFTLLHRYTELDLGGSEAKSPKCHIEIQRWSSGCYSLLDNIFNNSEPTLDLIFYINATPHTGVVTYLSTDESGKYSASEEHEEIDSAVLTILPKSNSLNIVYRNVDTTHFTKYVSHVKKGFDANVYTHMVVAKFKE